MGLDAKVMKSANSSSRPCPVMLPMDPKIPESSRGRVVAGRTNWWVYQGVVMEGSKERWRGPERQFPSKRGTVGIDGVAYEGDVPGCAELEATAKQQAQHDADMMAVRLMAQAPGTKAADPKKKKPAACSWPVII